MNYQNSTYYKLLLAATGLKFSGLPKDEAINKSRDIQPVLQMLLEQLAIEMYANGKWYKTPYEFVKIQVRNEAQKQAETHWNAIADKEAEFKRITSYGL